MKKRKITIGATIIALLMLATTIFNPIPAEKTIYEPKERDGDLIIKPDITNPSLTDITNTLTSHINSLSTAISKNNEIQTLIQKIQNNKQVQELIEQIQNTEDEKQKQLLAEQLIELIETLPEYQQLQTKIETQLSGLATEVNNVNQYIQMLLDYIDTQYDTQYNKALTEEMEQIEPTITSTTKTITINLMIGPSEESTQPLLFGIICAFNKALIDYCDRVATIYERAADQYEEIGDYEREQAARKAAQIYRDKRDAYQDIYDEYCQGRTMNINTATVSVVILTVSATGEIDTTETTSSSCTLCASI